MKAKLSSAALALALSAASIIPTNAQRLAVAASGGTNALSAATAEELREGIRGLEAALDNPTASAAERETNFGTLQSQRVRLYAMLRKRVNTMRAYQLTVASEAEKLAVDKDIEHRLGELRTLESELQKPLRRNTPARAMSAAAARSLFAAAQAKTSIEEQIKIKVNEIASSVSAKNKDDADLLVTHPDLVFLALARRESRKFVGDIEDIRVDKQVGGGSENAGSTSLVSKGLAPAILGFAAENGALTQGVSGTTITYRGNLVGTIEALRNQGFTMSVLDDSAATKKLRKLSYSFSFDTSRGSQAGTFVGDRQQLSSYSVRYEIKNDRDPRSPSYQAKWDALADADIQPLLDIATRIALDAKSEPALDRWNTKAQAAILAKGGSSERRDELIRQLDQELPSFNSFTPEVQKLLREFASRYENLLKNHSALRELISEGSIFTVEYTGDRRVGLVDTSNLKVIAEGDLLHLFGFGRGTTELTYNGSMTFFNSRPGPGMRRLRDFDHSLQLDYPFITGLGSFVFSFAGKYKRFTENDLAPGSVITIPGGTLTGAALANIKGDIASGQLKLSVPLSNGLRIPISVTFANRTELIKEHEVRANFGLTFDLDSLFSRRRP
ncbi:MAG: hypothetical protein LC774_11015 [Acidobacteria bacterium]|nr:hypothetical protein [Acidobacteriota bacterium]